MIQIRSMTYDPYSRRFSLQICGDGAGGPFVTGVVKSRDVAKLMQRVASDGLTERGQDGQMIARSWADAPRGSQHDAELLLRKIRKAARGSDSGIVLDDAMNLR